MNIILLLLLVTVYSFKHLLPIKLSSRLNLKYIEYKDDMDDFDKFEYYSTKNDTKKQTEYFLKILRDINYNKLFKKNSSESDIFNNINETLEEINNRLEEANEYLTLLENLENNDYPCSEDPIWYEIHENPFLYELD